MLKQTLTPFGRTLKKKERKLTCDEEMLSQLVSRHFPIFSVESDELLEPICSS